MFNTIYHIFRDYSIESMMQFIILSYVMYILCDSKNESLKAWNYVLGTTSIFSVILFIAIKLLPINYSTIIDTQALPYWFGFISSITIQFLCAHFLLKNSILYKMTYILFFQTFIMLFKVVCSPLYEMERTMNHSLYEKLDFSLILIELVLLMLFSVLFRKFKIQTSIRIPSKGMFFTLYFPISTLVCYILATNNRALYRYTNPMIGLVILTDLPIIYYIMSMITVSYEDQRRLDKALTQTQAQLARYRFSIELQEQLKNERHELKNNYFYIQTLLHEEKYEQLKDYMDNVIGEKMSNLNEIQTGNILMDYLLNRKVSEARKYHIKTYVEVLVPSQLNVSDDTLCTILLNLLDNAIEASQKETLPDIHITINCAKNYLVLKISNKSSHNVLNENPNLKTTKNDKRNHGLGLKIIRSTVKRSNGIFQIANEDGYFTATIMLPIQEMHSI